MEYINKKKAHWKISKTYRAWMSMRSRCKLNNPVKNSCYKNIKVDKSFNDFIDFFNHIGPPPTIKHQIDRIDSAGNYAPGNVRWVTTKEQNRNKKNNVWISSKFGFLCLSDYLKRAKIKDFTYKARVRRGWTKEEAGEFNKNKAKFTRRNNGTKKY